MQREYFIKIAINGKTYRKLVIDDHYEKKHKASVNDNMIITLVKEYLDNGFFEASRVDENGYAYFVTEPVFYNGKPFRLIWLLHDGLKIVGIVNCFRRRYGKKS